MIDVGAECVLLGIEAATYLKDGKVIGIEKKKRSWSNKSNVKIQSGKLLSNTWRAPQDIPETNYDRMFIGGSTGGMKIVEHFIKYSKPDSRLVINAITLERQIVLWLYWKKRFNIEVVKYVSIKRKESRSILWCMEKNPIYINVSCEGIVNE